jgi:hypothetical protein
VPDFLARAVLPHTSGLPSDVTINDFAFAGPETGPQVAAAVIQLYNDPSPSSGQALGAYLSGVVSRALLASRIELYAILTAGQRSGADPLGSPVLTVPFTLSVSNVAIDLPGEVACALSFRASYLGLVEEIGNTRPRSRRRGRVFIGPLNQQAVTTDAVSEARPAAAFISDLVAVGARLRDSITSTWCVWSRMDALFAPVETVWADNAFDTIRSRGHRATARTSNP